MLAPSPRVPVRWPSEISLGDSTASSYDGDLSASSPSRRSVYTAAEQGDIPLMTAYLAAGGNVNKRSKEGYSILHLAAMRDQEAMVELLLKHGVDPDAHDNGEGLTPLMWAAQLGYEGVVASLIEGGADTEQEDREDLTALHWAARLGKECVVVSLLDHAADVEAVDYDGNTPLIWAVRGGHRGCVGRLLDAGANTTTPDENGNTALHFACQTGHAGIASDLLDWGALATAQDYWEFTPFHRACSQGHGNVLVELLRARAPGKSKQRVIRRDDREDSNDFFFGGLSGSWGGSGAGSSGGRSSSLGGGRGEGAGGRGSGLGKVEEGGGRGGGGGSGDVSLTPALGLPSKVVDVRNHFQATPLHRAAAKGHAEVTTMLLQNGASVDSRDGFFYTPLHLACVNGAVSCVDVLLRAGADPAARAQGSVTPLIAARKPEVRELLKEALASREKKSLWAVDVSSTAGGTPRSDDGSGGGGGGGGASGSDQDVRNRHSASAQRFARAAGGEERGVELDTNSAGVSGGTGQREGGGKEATGLDALDLAAPASAIKGASSAASGLSATIAAVRATSGTAGGMEIDDDDNDNDSGQTVGDVSGKGHDEVLFADCCDGSAGAGEWGELMATTKTTPTTTRATRGRPVSRLPRDRERERRAETAPRRPRRSSTGSMLEKLFNSSSGPYQPYKVKDEAAAATASCSGIGSVTGSENAAEGTDPASTEALAPMEEGMVAAADAPAPGAEAEAALPPPAQMIPPEMPLHMAPRISAPRCLAAAIASSAGVVESAPSAVAKKASGGDAAESPSPWAVSEECGEENAGSELSSARSSTARRVTGAASSTAATTAPAPAPPAAAPPRAGGEAEPPTETAPLGTGGGGGGGGAAATTPTSEPYGVHDSGDTCGGGAAAAAAGAGAFGTANASATAPPAAPAKPSTATIRCPMDTGEEEAGVTEAGVGAGAAPDGPEGMAPRAPVPAPAPTKKRRAKSLPPSCGRDRGPQRRPRLESRPCLEGPSSVIEKLTLSDDDDGDGDAWAVSRWLKGAAAAAAAAAAVATAGQAGVGGADDDLGGGSRGSSPALLPLRRATTLVG